MEIIRLSNGEGLLVEGPTRIEIAQGTVNLFGKTYSAGDKFVVVYGKTYPLQAISNSELKLFLGSLSKYTRVKERLIPQEWDTLVNHLLNQKRKVVMILGDEDTGKSSLALYTANRLSSQGWKVAVVDADIGQSDVGPPGVIGLCVVDAPLLTLRSVPLLSGFFIGDKSPVGHFPAMIYGTKKMVDEALNLSVGTILINTTGMIYGRHARDLKEKKIDVVSPNIVVALQREKEVEHLLALFKNKIVILRLPVPPRIKRTSRRKRVSLRGSLMHKYIENRKKTIYMDTVVFKETLIGMGAEKPNETKELSKILNCEVLYVEEVSDMMLIIIRNTFPGEKISKLTKRYNKEVSIVGINELQRLMLGLLNNKEKFLSVGFLESIDFKTRQMTISTGLKDLNQVKYVVFGYLRIEYNGNELGSRKIGAF